VLHTQFKPPVLGCHAANPNRTRAPPVSRTAHQNLLSLQARAASDDTTSAVLKQSAARVHTIAAIHDRLYRSGSALQVEIAPYLQGLIEDLQGALGSDAGGRHIHLSADMAVWPASEVPAIGLVLTELVTNALKYGQGTVTVAFREAPNEPPTLTSPTRERFPPISTRRRAAG
jgi:two-component sensor histidine kinase